MVGGYEIVIWILLGIASGNGWRPSSTSRTLISKKIHDRSGQTTIEYLLLLAMAFITTYLMITGPVANFTADMLNRFSGALVNVVQNAELRPGVLNPGDNGHPGSPARIERLH